MRALLVAKRSAREARIKAVTQIRHLSFTAPDELRARLKALSCDTLAEQTASMRPRAQAGSVMFAHKLALSSLGGRVQALDDEIARIDDVQAGRELLRRLADEDAIAHAEASSLPPKR